MDIDSYYHHVRESSSIDFGKFYGACESLPLGSGLVYSGVRIPLYMPSEGVYATIKGWVYVLTHECDVSQSNHRPFKDSLLVCPIIPLEKLIEQYLDSFPTSSLTSFLNAVAKRQVYRVLYIPPIEEELRYGGFLFLNNITHTSVLEIEREGVCKRTSLSAYGVREVDFFLRNHLLRPKSEVLPLEI